jgi:hypothetical protein
MRRAKFHTHIEHQISSKSIQPDSTVTDVIKPTGDVNFHEISSKTSVTLSNIVKI